MKTGFCHSDHWLTCSLSGYDPRAAASREQESMVYDTILLLIPDSVHSWGLLYGTTWEQIPERLASVA
jgi:hypothetical protein